MKLKMGGLNVMSEDKHISMKTEGELDRPVSLACPRSYKRTSVFRLRIGPSAKQPVATCLLSFFGPKQASLLETEATRGLEFSGTRAMLPFFLRFSSSLDVIM